MKPKTKLLPIVWMVFLAGLAYALLVPVGEASAWVVLTTDLLGLPLVIHLGVVMLGKAGQRS